MWRSLVFCMHAMSGIHPYLLAVSCGRISEHGYGWSMLLAHRDFAVLWSDVWIPIARFCWRLMMM
jgi:hypothetical protein